VFLSAEWRHLAMLNWAVEPDLLQPYVPDGTELDAHHGRHFVSVVGLMFYDTRVRGVAIPFHRTFEELNLRFYVRRKADDGWRRGVVFIRELVPKRLVAWVARYLYNEQYSYAAMNHEITRGPGDEVTAITYLWSYRRSPGRIELALNEPLGPMISGSEEEFIAEHYWGYAAQRTGGTKEYRVLHPRWSVAAAAEARFECDVERLYGRQFVEPLSSTPSSAFYADGSAVEVYDGTRL
jgi:uncharacterized protein YqjF (DUF2071 family)